MTKESQREDGPKDQRTLGEKFDMEVWQGQLDGVVIASFMIEHPLIAETAVRKELSHIKKKKQRKAK